MRLNEEIPSETMRVIDADGKQIGVLIKSRALELAAERNLDLVEIVPNASPPVCRIMDFGKYKYQLSKKEKLSKKKQHVIHVKEIRFRPTIDSHDIETKLKQARKFLDMGDHVRVRIMFRGRQIVHPELGRAVLDRVQKDLSDIAKMEKDAITEDRSIVVTFIKK
ncbi:MAG: translation initiation factor IF-3 [bacterium]|nr:translation initiation factor IF-3 [bacterium]